MARRENRKAPGGAERGDADSGGLRAAECRGRAVVPVLHEARGPAGRALGLMFRRDLPRGEGLWLRPCGSVHTCFMRFPLDLVFLDAGGAVVRLARGVRPWRMAFGGRGARSTIEVRSGWLAEDDVRPGDRLAMRPAP